MATMEARSPAKAALSAARSYGSNQINQSYRADLNDASLHHVDENQHRVFLKESHFECSSLAAEHIVIANMLLRPWSWSGPWSGKHGGQPLH